jgi:hypothetical protein
MTKKATGNCVSGGFFRWKSLSRTSWIASLKPFGFFAASVAGS